MKTAPKLLSVVIPLFNEEETLPLLKKRLRGLRDLIESPVQFVLVNDGSRDRTSTLLDAWANEDPSVAVVHFSRNFGHQVAMTAGIDLAQGDVIVTMDGDLQDPPEFVPKLVDKWADGYDVIFAKRSSREGETVFKRATAKAFYRILRTLGLPQLHEDSGDFVLLSLPAANALRELREVHRFNRAMIAWLGFRQTTVQLERPARLRGETKYSLTKMLRLALDAMISFSRVPLRITTGMGLLVLAASIAFSLKALIDYQHGDVVRGWTSLVILVAFLGGGILFSLGILGEYIGRIYEEIKGRPLYVVRETRNLRLLHAIPRAVTPNDDETPTARIRRSPR